MAKIEHSNDDAMTEIEIQNILAENGGRWPQEEIEPGRFVDVDPASLKRAALAICEHEGKATS